MERLLQRATSIREGRTQRVIRNLLISSSDHSSSRLLFPPVRSKFSCGHRLRRLMIGLSLSIILISGAPTIAAAGHVRDQLGRPVDLPDHPQRIISLAPSITEILYVLEMEHRIVGATQFSDYPPAAAALPKVGSYVRLDVEKIVSLNPDLCIAVKDGNPIDVIEKLESLGIAVYAVDPRNLKAVRDTIMELGKILDHSQRAKAVTDAMDTVVTSVQTRVAGVTHRPGVFFQIGISPIVSAGTPTFIHELITMAGGVNLSRGKIPYPRYSKEQIIGMGPDVIIITSMARNAVFEKVKAQWQQWRDLPAVKNDRIHLVDSDIFDRASPRLVEGLTLLAQLIHPARFQPGNEEKDQWE